MHRRFALALVLVFLGAMAVIEMNRQGVLPEVLAAHTPTNHFHAVDLAFTLVLILEVVSLIFTLPCSFSKSVGKQFEILSLILDDRSEERRVGKECRSRWSPYH